MNFSNREDAVLADAMIQALIDKDKIDKSQSISETELTQLFSITPEHLKSILQIANRYQKRNSLNVLIRTNTAIDMADDTQGFINTGGFTGIWDSEKLELEAKEKVNTVNSSVLLTNKTVRIMAVITGFATVTSLAVAIMAYNKANEVNVKELQQLPKYIQQIQSIRKRIDTVYL